jgi:hypothetical protein
VWWSAVQLQVFPTEVDFDLEVERAPDDGSGGAGLPGAPDTGLSTSFVISRSGDHYDPLPPDYAFWWYRARHVALDAGGAVTNASPWTAWQFTQARPPGTLLRSPIVLIGPVVSVANAAVARATASHRDRSQGRVESVEFRPRFALARRVRRRMPVPTARRPR